MYPASFFSLFPVFPVTNRVFVAMSFESRFDHRWNNVLVPAISRIDINAQPLVPHRIDLSKSGDSILTQILDEIARSRIVVGDISSLGSRDGIPIRNQNVFYELGIAHAVRLPEEVLLFRSDDEPLAFDISNVRVHKYDPDRNVVAAQQVVQETIAAAFQELALRRHLAIRRAADLLDSDSLTTLVEAQGPPWVRNPIRSTMGELLTGGMRMDCIHRLLDLGAIRATFARITADTLGGHTFPVEYRSTPFGSELLVYVTGELGLNDPALQARIFEKVDGVPPKVD